MSMLSSFSASPLRPLAVLSIALLAAGCVNPEAAPTPETVAAPVPMQVPGTVAVLSQVPRRGGAAPDAPVVAVEPLTAVGQDLNGVWSVAAGDVWAVGAAGTILHYDGSWTAELSPTRFELRAVWALADGRAWAVGAAGTILERAAGHWTVAASPTGADLWGIWGSGPGDLWAAGDTGLILHWDGSRWSVAHDRGAGTLRGVWGSGPSDVWVVGGGKVASGDDASLILHWDGRAWSESTVCHVEGSRFGAAGWVAELHDVWGVSGGPVFAAGVCMPGASFVAEGHLVRHDADWTESLGLRDPLAEERPLGAIWGSGASDLWAASAGHQSQGPALLHYDGTSWTESPAAVSDAVRDLGGSAPDDIWAVGARGLRLHYDGRSWTATP